MPSSTTTTITCLPSNLLEEIRKLSHKWQPEWMPVCQAFRQSAIDHRTEKHQLLLPLWHKEQLADRLRRIAAAASSMPIRLASPHVLFPSASMQLRKDRVKAVPLPERMFAPFSLVAQRRYFRTHHNLHDVADCLVVCLEAAAALGLSPRIRGVELFLIAPDDEKTYAAYADEGLLAALLAGLPNLEAFTVRAQVPRFRCDGGGFVKESHSFRSSFMHRLLCRTLAESASLRRVTIVDASFPSPSPYGMDLLDLAEFALTGYYKAPPNTSSSTLSRQWFIAHEVNNNHDFPMPNAASRLERLRIENVSSQIDWISDRFWAIAGSQQVARLELVNTQIWWPSAQRRGGAKTIFPGGRISRPAMTLAISTNTPPRGAVERFDPDAFGVEGVVLEE